MVDKYAYRVIWSDEDNEFAGLCADFPSLSWLSDSQDSAFRGIRELVASVVDELRENCEPVPEPMSTRRFSGKFIVRIPPEQHQRLVIEAQEANISLNRHVAAKLSK
jgi:predicted HicB family RNase H-like nuclease